MDRSTQLPQMAIDMKQCNKLDENNEEIFFVAITAVA